jgi:hypothetical protein
MVETSKKKSAPKPKTFAELKEKHAIAEKAWVMKVLNRTKFQHSDACAELGVSALAPILKRYDLAEIYYENSPGRGRRSQTA